MAPIFLFVLLSVISFQHVAMTNFELKYVDNQPRSGAQYYYSSDNLDSVKVAGARRQKRSIINGNGCPEGTIELKGLWGPNCVPYQEYEKLNPEYYAEKENDIEEYEHPSARHFEEFNK